VRGELVSFLPFVHLDDLVRVDGQHLVRVDHHAEQAGVRLGGENARAEPCMSSPSCVSVDEYSITVFEAYFRSICA